MDRCTCMWSCMKLNTTEGGAGEQTMWEGLEVGGGGREVAG